MSNLSDNSITVGDYLVVQRWNFMKIIHLGGNKANDFDVVLGNDIVNIANAVGKQYWSTFKLIPIQTNKAKKRLYSVELCDGVEKAALHGEIIKDLTSGIDNRDIKDDGKSQALSTENIHELKECGKSANDIVGQLIENSTTFQKKTEYAQEKYLSKKKRKYYDFILLRPTSLRLMIEINNKKDASKYLGMTMDTLSHLITACNIQPGGTYLTYENGCSGIISAMILNYLDTTGRVIQIHPGPYPQKSSVLSLNFSNEKLKSYIPISVRDIIDICKSFKEMTNDSIDKTETNLIESSLENSDISEIKMQVNSDIDMSVSEDISEVNDNSELQNNSSETSTLANDIGSCEINGSSTTTDNKSNLDQSKLTLKRKNSAEDFEINKKSCYEIDLNLKSSVENILSNKVDGLIIVCKEHPSSVLFEFIKYVAPSRPIIVYSLYREPLVDLFLELKTCKHPVINIRLTESFLRSYQVLPERTHPHMAMSSTSGYLLTATVIAK